MRIVFFTENSYAGGLDSVIINLINHWPVNEENSNHTDDLILICNSSHPGLDMITRQIERPFKVVAHQYSLHWQWLDTVCPDNLPKFLRKLLSAVSRYPFFIYWLWIAKSLLVAQEADRLLVINGGYPAGDSCRAAAIAWSSIKNSKPKCVFNFHNLAVRPRWWEKWAENIVDRIVANSSKRFVAVSKACADSMKNRPIIAARGKVDYIYNGVAKEAGSTKSSIEKVRYELGIANDVPMCLMLGTYEPRKGHAFLFKAFKRVLKRKPNAILVVCGFGYEDDIRRVSMLVKDFGLTKNVILKEFRSDAFVLIEIADILLVSSQAYESFGLTIVEAMARATPVVATNIGGIPEVMGKDLGGFCVPYNDPDEYAKKVLELLESREMRERMGFAGLKRYKKNFTANRMAIEYAKIVHDQESD